VKTLFITHFYPPEPAAGATRVESFVGALVDAGHEVTVVTNFPSFPQGRFSERGRPWMRVERTEGGARIVRLFSLLVPGMPGSRLLHWLTASASAAFYALTSPDRYDVVAISSPPITLAFPGMIAAWRHRAKLVVDVRDVFPDVAIAMGAWKRGSLQVRAVERLVRALYKRADLVVAVTPTAIDQIAARGVPASRLLLARNAAERCPPVAASDGTRNGFTAIYAGNLGLATDVDVLLDAAALVASENITIEIVGDGAQRPHLGERLRAERTQNVVVRGSLPRGDAMARVAGADVSIVPLRKGIEESIPTKIYDSMSVGCPVIVAADGEARREGASLGAYCTPPGDGAALAQTLRQLARLDRTALRAIGESGRAAVTARADRSHIMDELVERIGALP
jgi:glycosyltransferase involved in cell wall biosynthesis